MKSLFAILTALNMVAAFIVAASGSLAGAAACAASAIVTGGCYAVLDRLDQIRDAIMANKPAAPAASAVPTLAIPSMSVTPLASPGAVDAGLDQMLATRGLGAPQK